jgi:hypothetical protein
MKMRELCLTKLLLNGKYLTTISLILAMVLSATSTIRPERSKSHSLNKVSDCIWIGASPSGKLTTMLIASLSISSSPQLTAFTNLQGSSMLEYKGSWSSEDAVCVVSGLTVYRDSVHQRLFIVIDVAGVSTVGIVVVRLDKDGKFQTLYTGLNYGYPRVRLRNGELQVVEIWPLMRLILMNHWIPPKEYDAHVLQERIYSPGPKGKYILKVMRPAIEEEKKLSLKERHDFLVGKKNALKEIGEP